MKGGEKVTEFEEVYRRYFRDVYQYALSLTRDEHIAEEITQETFFKALRSIDQFDGRCKIYVWLCQIAKNAQSDGAKLLDSMKDYNIDKDVAKIRIAYSKYLGEE